MAVTIAANSQARPSVSKAVERRVKRPAAPALDMDALAEIQSVLGYGTTNSALNSIDIEILGPQGASRPGRVEGMAPLDLLGEFREPVKVGDVTPLRLSSDMLGVRADTLGLVHWQRNVGGRWLAGLFLRESLPREFLNLMWMDMRKELRFPVQIPLQAAYNGEPMRFDVIARDYSRSGARLESNVRPRIGQSVEIFDGELLAIGTVRFVHPTPAANAYFVGCEFANNEGVRLSHRSVSQTETRPEVWASAETWEGPAVRI